MRSFVATLSPCQKLSSLTKRLNKDKGKSKQNDKVGSSSARKHKKTKRHHKKKKRKVSSVKKQNEEQIRRVRRQNPRGQKAKHRIRRNKWITNKSQFRQAMKSGDVDVYQVKYKISLLRYRDVSWKSHEDTFELPKDSSDAEVRASVELLVKDHIRVLNRQYGYDVRFYIDEDTSDDGFVVVSIIKITNESQLTTYLSNGVVNLVSARYNTIKDKFHWYEGDTKCWITAIVQAYFFMDIEDREEFRNTNKKLNSMKTGLQLEEEFQDVLNRLGERWYINQ